MYACHGEIYPKWYEAPKLGMDCESDWHALSFGTLSADQGTERMKKLVWEHVCANALYVWLKYRGSPAPSKALMTNFPNKNKQ